MNAKVKQATELKEELLSIEYQLWSNDPVLYRDNLDEDAMLVFGETGVISRETAVEAIKKENNEGRRWAEVEFDEEKVALIDTNTAVLLYKSASRWEHEKEKIYAMATSIYVNRDDSWKLILHQQTPIDASQFKKVGTKYKK